MDAYLRCLATAGEHGRPVPHFAKAGEYELIMDPTFQPKKKRRKKVVEFQMQACFCLLQNVNVTEGRLDWI